MNTKNNKIKKQFINNIKDRKNFFKFEIEKKLENKSGKKFLGRVGRFQTAHGEILTPAFATVGTKAAIKGLTVEQLQEIQPEVFLANTYHLYLSPGPEIIKKHGGLHKFSRWDGPIMTDSGGFQAFSLGAAFGKNISKIAKDDTDFIQTKKNENTSGFAKITEDGVAFRNYKSGEKLFFSPEKSMQIQEDLGADIAFAFDECTSPQATYEYQKEAMERTHRWAIRSLEEHQKLEKKKTSFFEKAKKNISNFLNNASMLLQEAGPERDTRDQTTDPASYPQALFGIVQGGRFQDLREESAKFIGSLDFDGFGIGGSFDKDDMEKAVAVVNKILPENKPRHLLGIGEPIDIFMGVENGVDFFDCVAPTRMARHGALHTKKGRLNITRAQFKDDMNPIEKGCQCYTCQNYTRAYVNHLMREGEMLGMTLTTIHNLHFIVNLVKEIRQSILEDRFFEFKEEFLKDYYKK